MMAARALLKFGYALLCLGVLSGCAPTRPALEPQAFLLEPRAPEPVATRTDAPIVRIARFSIAPQFDTKSIVYRRDAWRYESDFYNEYLASPKQMLAERCAQWLRARGNVRIAIPGNGDRADHVLNAAINQFYIDLRAQPTAVLDIHFTLADVASTPALLLDKDYHAEVVASSATAADNVEAMSRALEQILIELDRDLATLKPDPR